MIKKEIIAAIISDLHIKPDLKIWYTQQAKNDFILSCKQLQRIIQEKEIPNLLIGGDIFDSPKITSDCLYNLYNHLLYPIKESSCKIFYVLGQHDAIPSWLLVFPEIKHVDQKHFRIGSHFAYGLDFKPEPVGFLATVKAPILLTHQVFTDFIIHGLCSTADIPQDTILTLTGDFHKHEIIDLPYNRKLVSIGPFCHSSGHAARGVDSGIILLYNDLDIEYIRLLQRPIYRFSGMVNIEQAYNQVLEDSQKIRQEIMAYNVPDVDVPVIILEVTSENAEDVKRQTENLTGVYWKLLPKIEKRVGFQPSHQELVDHVDFLSWVKTEFDLIYPKHPNLTSRLFHLFRNPLDVEKWKEFFKRFEEEFEAQYQVARN